MSFSLSHPSLYIIHTAPEPFQFLNWTCGLNGYGPEELPGTLLEESSLDITQTS